MRAVFEATVGRRLLIRIWIHGLFLFAGVVAMTLVARFAMPSAMQPGEHTLLHALTLVATALVLTLLLVALPLARDIARPLERLGALARDLGRGNLAVRAPAERLDEIGDLARSFNRMADQIQRLRTAERQLLADVSHELRTPVARMHVVLDLAGDADAEAMRGYLREVATDLAELEELLDDIIVSSRLDLAQLPLRRRSTKIEELVEATAARFRARWPERELVCRVSGERMVVDVDPILARRALDNLVDNARKYSPEGTPIALVVDCESAARVRIAVVDRGVGIRPEDQARVFTPFFRADRSRSRSTGGVGLGLTLARRIAEAHGGSIGFTSAPDRGSCFWLAFPLAPAGAAFPGPSVPGTGTSAKSTSER